MMLKLEFFPRVLSKIVGFLMSHRELMNIKDILETGPTVYSP